MQKQRLIILTIGIVFAVAAIIITKIYIDQQVRTRDEQRKKILAQQLASQAAVLVAKEDIPRGAMVEPGMLETAIIPGQYIQPQAATSLDRIAGMVTLAPISKGEQIVLSKLASSKQAGAETGLAELTPIGKRAITISVENISSLLGMLQPGNYVDVIAIVPVPVQTQDGKQAVQAAVMQLFQNVLVLAVGQETSILPRETGGRYAKEETKKEASPYITLALSPQEANILAFVQEQGKIRLVLRSPADSQLQPTQPASWDTLFQYVMPKEEAKPQVKEEAPVGYVEIYRGLNKERVPLSK